jgi:hypothetical protein
MSLKKITRSVLYVAGTLLLLLLLLHLLVGYYVNRRLVDDLKEKVDKGTNHKYSLELKNASLSLFNRSLTLENVLLLPVPEKDGTGQTFKLKAEYITLEGVELFRLWRNKSLFAQNLEVGSLVINIYRTVDSVSTDTNSRNFSLYKVLSPKIRDLQVMNIDVLDSRLRLYKSEADTGVVLTSDDNDIHLHNFLVNGRADSLGNIFLADKFEMTMKSFSYATPDKLYLLSGKNMFVSYNDSLVNADSLALVPQYSKKEFSKAAGKQMSRTKLRANGISFKKIDPKLFFERGWFVCHKLVVANMNLDVYRDMNAPYVASRKPTVQEIVKKVPFLLKIDTIDLITSHVAYSQLAKDKVQPGTVSFYKLNGRITGARNDSTPGKVNKMVMKLSTRFMNEGEIKATYVFPLNTRKEVFECSGRVGPMSLLKTSNVLKHLINVSVRKGQLDSVVFEFKMNGERADGWLKMLYHDFEIDLADSESKKQRLKKKVLTFFANEFIIKDQNPLPGKEPRITKIDYERNPNKYLFYNTWKSLQSAILPAIGLKNADLLINNPKK